MFESNFPGDRARMSYPVLSNALKRLARGGSASEKADLFGATGSRSSE
jgi:predicted TIM-barrel fold metal-dependent hydrolase